MKFLKELDTFLVTVLQMKYFYTELKMDEKSNKTIAKGRITRKKILANR